ncbi:MAG: hypothetical protein A2231_03970 [Candidatus Firestonebacteria bacterium RIFOXYA2_FULL_40_8]|nr:MAG: hypothetical protein A2231_03970 [Candidatus Firestonebacteria bacterium RIFOXYA2_FULL_40_8]
MRIKNYIFTMLFIGLFTTFLFAGGKASDKFTDSLTGLSFRIPAGWEQAKEMYPPVFFSLSDKEVKEKHDLIILEKYFRDVPVEEAFERYWENFKKSFDVVTMIKRREVDVKDRKAVFIYFSYQKEKNAEDEEKEKEKRMLMLFIKTGSIINVLEFYNKVITGNDAVKLMEKLAGTVTFETSPKVLHSLFSAKENDIEEFLKNKEYDMAREIADKALLESPSDPQLLMQKAVLCATLKQDEEAAKYIEEAFLQGYFDITFVIEREEFKGLIKKGLLQNFLKNKNEIIKKGRKILLAKVKKELASYYEVRIPETNVILYTDIKDNARIKNLKHSMVTAANFAKEELKIEKSEFPILWVMSESRDVNKALIGTLFGTSSGFEGVFVPAFGIFFSDTLTGYGTFVHEYMHALHSGDQALVFQQHPRWLTEMLSTTFETLKWNYVKEKVEVKYRSERLDTLVIHFSRGKHAGLEKIITDEKGWNKDVDIGVFYAAVRYLGIYLYSENLLGTFYKEYKKNYKDDRSGVKAFEKVTGKKIAEFEKDWERWLPTITGKE